VVVTRCVAGAVAGWTVEGGGEHVGHDFFRVRCTDPVSSSFGGVKWMSRCGVVDPAVLKQLYGTQGVEVSTKAWWRKVNKEC
jgi:hypothetical protein